MQRHKVILDIDNALTVGNDTDDAWALAMALTSPEMELVGITTCAGNCRTWQSTKETLRMLELADRGDIPVASGREDPLILNVEAHWQYKGVKDARRLAEYYGHMPTSIEPTLQESPLKAHELIIEQVKKHPGEVIIVKEGSFTNLAVALLVEPEIAPLVKEVVHMGGSFLPEGVDLSTRNFSSPDNPADVWRYVLKFNTGFDPESSAIIFRSGIPVTFVTGNVTGQVFQYREDLERLRELNTPYHQLLYDAGLGWLDWSVAERKLVGAHMHDPLTLAVVIDRSFCTFQDMHIDVDKFLAGEWPWLLRSDKEPQGSVAVDVDKERFEKWLADRLATPLLTS
jgi:purine nucleosidase